MSQANIEIEPSEAAAAGPVHTLRAQRAQAGGRFVVNLPKTIGGSLSAPDHLYQWLAPSEGAAAQTDK